MPSQIKAIEYVFPDNVLTNEMLSKEFPDYDFQSFEKKVGIANRYIVHDGETALDLAVKACEKLFNRYDKSKVDYILYCTQSPDYALPTTACILQERIGLRNDIGAFDFNLGCSGYTYGLSMARALIDSNQANNVLLVTAETYSKYLHPKDRSNRAIFGDAATATIIEETEEEYMGQFLFGTDGSGHDKLIVKNGCAKFSYDAQSPEKNYGTDNFYTDNNLYMDGPEIMNFTTSTIPSFTNSILEKNNLTVEDIDQFILHQANSFMLNVIRKRLKILPENFYIDLADGGNTVSSTIPIALKKYSETLTPNEIQNIMLVGFGVGLSWSGGMVKINDAL